MLVSRLINLQLIKSEKLNALSRKISVLTKLTYIGGKSNLFEKKSKISQKKYLFLSQP